MLYMSQKGFRSNPSPNPVHKELSTVTHWDCDTKNMVHNGLVVLSDSVAYRVCYTKGGSRLLHTFKLPGWTIMRTAVLEKKCSQHCGARITKYFRDIPAPPPPLFFFFFLARLEILLTVNQKWGGISTIVSPCRSEEDSVPSSVLQSHRRIWDFISMNTTTRGTEPARASSLLPMKWAKVWSLSLFSHFRRNVFRFGSQNSTSKVNCLPLSTCEDNVFATVLKWAIVTWHVCVPCKLWSTSKADLGEHILS